ncbi:hypothetical protein H0H81_010529 [Sphagnurus paluster]|uniref:Uncharacterized protein n=1 Tax=Sphagnurus paluster TaxID=117069 RepID=A0A9P7FNX4_9AGAR|nr:hypothetical protein H0H81_010529 [Sphagnurus paluster]
MIRHIGDLPALKECGTLYVPEDIPHAELAGLFTTRNNERFSHLRNLKLESTTSGPLEVVINALQRPLDVLELYVGDNPRPVALLNLTTALRQHTCTTSLKRLSLKTGAPEEGDEDQDSAFFAPLFALKGLKQLNVSSHYTSKVTDRDLLGAAAAWPCLEELIFEGHITDHNVTLPGLAPLLTKCPRLTILVIPVLPVPFDTGILDPNLNSEVDLLNLSSLVAVAAADVEGVSRCLARLFPKLRVFLIDMDARGPELGWSAVGNGLDAHLGRIVSY